MITINRAHQEFISSSVDVLRIAGYDDWQLYSRWNEADCRFAFFIESNMIRQRVKRVM